MNQKNYLIVISGTPAGGKNTLAERVSKKYNCPFFDMGDHMRERIKTDPKFSEKAQETLVEGGLVSDEIACDVFNENVEKILDKTSKRNDAYENNLVRGVFSGFPRTITQTRYLLNMLSKKYPLIFILLKTKKRIAHARLFKNPAGRKGREDDKKERFPKRWNEYEHDTQPAVHLLKHSVPTFVLQTSSLSPEQVYGKTLEFLEKESPKQIADDV